MIKSILFVIVSMFYILSCNAPKQNQNPQTGSSDENIQSFLDARRGKWTDFNVPYEDGRALEKLVVENSSKNILEIGTSSGHSTIWLAKGAAKTGGKVTTIEIDEGRFHKARQNFAEAGVSHLVTQKLGDAMKIIPTLNGEFDFVFSDATWSTQPQDGYLMFFKLTNPKLKTGGLYTMHNVSDGAGDDGRFFRYLDSLGNFQTHVINATSRGISVSKKLR